MSKKFKKNKKKKVKRKMALCNWSGFSKKNKSYYRTRSNMRHYQKQFECSVCGKVIIIDITSMGVTHQMIQGVTCFDCAKNAPDNNIMGDRVEEIEFEKPVIMNNDGML